MGASSSRPSTTCREVAFRSTEKKQHGFPQLKASGRQPGVQPPEAARERGPDPDTALQETRRRVASLEAALQAMEISKVQRWTL